MFIQYCDEDGISKFNRNILYCKFADNTNLSEDEAHLIGTFCIVNSGALQ